MLVKRGNPFFLEETVRTLVETGVLAGERGAYQLTRPVEALQIPATVQTILAARIDRLSPEEKRLLQTASVIGKDVPHALLVAVAEQPEDVLRRGLGHLQEAEFLYETRLFPDRELTFKHALTQDVAYAGLLGERRRALHGAVVTAIERLHADRLAEHVERLAHHARQGEVWDKAARYLRQAGAKVFLRSANREAATYFEHALDALGRLPNYPDAIAESLDIRFELRNPLSSLGEGEKVRALLDEAEACAEAAGDQRRLGLALTYKVIQSGLDGDFAAAIRMGHRALAIGEAQADTPIQVLANNVLGRTYVVRGECGQTIRHCKAALALIPESLRHERFGHSNIATVYAHYSLARALGALGQFPEAFGHLREALQIAEEVGHDYSVVFALLGLGTLKVEQGDFAGAVAPLERGLDLCTTKQIAVVLDLFAWARGAAYHGIGRHVEGIALMEDAARNYAGRTSRMLSWSGRVGPLGDAYLRAGRLADAARVARDGLVEARQRGERVGEGHTLRLLGDVAAHPDRGEVDIAEVHYREALALTEPLGLRPLIAHCHLGLGRLYRRTDKPAQAQEHLTTATTMYREMDMRFWLEQAEAEVKEVADASP
jgi:tetratricopeptide (TPR) repeat protein